MRTSEDKYRDGLKRGRTLVQLRAIASARNDNEFRTFLDVKLKQHADVGSDLLS